MKEKTFGFAAIGSAILASTCCILPIVAATFSIGVGSTAAAFEEWRPVLIVITVLMLGFSYYQIYFKRKSTECADGTCKTKSSSPTGKLILWVATFLAIVITLFPNYSKYIL